MALLCEGKNLVIVLLALSGFVGTFSVPIENFDYPDVYDSVLPKYDHFAYHDVPEVTPVPTSVETTLTVENLTDTKVETITVGEVDQNMLDAAVELEALGAILESESKYIENRKKQDPSWPDTLAAKVGSKFATPEDQRMFNEDLQHAISAVSVMKMMEERLAYINRRAEQKLSAPNTDINALFVNSEKNRVIQGLFELKYFEGLLHSVNSMVDETLAEEGLSLPFPLVPGNAAHHPFKPKENKNNDDDEIVLGIGEFVILLFTGIGFLFVLFLIFYLLLKGVQICFETSSDFNKKLHYERI